MTKKVINFPIRAKTMKYKPIVFSNKIHFNQKK